MGFWGGLAVLLAVVCALVGAPEFLLVLVGAAFACALVWFVLKILGSMLASGWGAAAIVIFAIVAVILAL